MRKKIFTFISMRLCFRTCIAYSASYVPIPSQKPNCVFPNCASHLWKILICTRISLRKTLNMWDVRLMVQHLSHFSVLASFFFGNVMNTDFCQSGDVFLESYIWLNKCISNFRPAASFSIIFKVLVWTWSGPDALLFRSGFTSRDLKFFFLCVRLSCGSNFAIDFQWF